MKEVIWWVGSTLKMLNIKKRKKKNRRNVWISNVTQLLLFLLILFCQKIIS